MSTFDVANPEAASSELFLRACKPLLDKDSENADWHAVQKTIKAAEKQFYLADLSKFGPGRVPIFMRTSLSTHPHEKQILQFHHSHPAKRYENLNP